MNSKGNKQEKRWALLREINRITDKPLLFLSFVWLVLVIIELTLGLNLYLYILIYIIWSLFILDLVIEFIIAPDKPEYLKGNWIVAISIFLPALGLLRLFWIFKLLNLTRFLRSVVLLKLITAIRHGFKAISLILSRRGLGYAIALTVIVTFSGAAGIYYFENPVTIHQEGYQNVAGLKSYWDALWWTAMIMTTMGSQYWPVTVEGRILCWLLALYAFIFFTYITATIASYFIKPEK